MLRKAAKVKKEASKKTTISYSTGFFIQSLENINLLIQEQDMQNTTDKKFDFKSKIWFQPYKK